MRRILLACILLTILGGCGHKTRLKPPEPRRVETVSSVEAELLCGKISVNWSPVFFDNRGNPLDSSPSYIVLRRRGGPVEKENEPDEPREAEAEAEAEADTELGTEVLEDSDIISKLNSELNSPAETTPETDLAAEYESILPMEYDYSLVAIIPGINVTLNDPNWNDSRMEWEDAGAPSGPIWTIQKKTFKKPKGFPPEKDPEETYLSTGYYYYYMVIAIEADGTTSHPSPAIQIPWVSIAGQPDNVVSDISQTEVVLTWNAPDTDCLEQEMEPPTTFEIHRRQKDAEEFLLIGNCDELTYTDKTTDIDTVYEYKVRSLEQPLNVPGQFSEALVVDTTDTFPPAVPLDLTGAISILGVHLNWRQVENDDLAGYRIYRKDGVSGEFELMNPDKLIVNNTYTDETTTGGITYYYRVSSVDKSSGMNESEPGNVWSATIK